MSEKCEAEVWVLRSETVTRVLHNNCVCEVIIIVSVLH